jgi:hypothetical protein
MIYPGPGQAIGLSAGQSLQLSNASVGGAATLQAVALGPVAGEPADVTIYNHSATTLTVVVADADTGSANYLALTDAATGTAITCAAGIAITFRTSALFLAVKTAGDPGATVIAISR